MAANRTFAFRPSVLSALLSAGVACSLHAAVMPVGFNETILTNGLSSATAMAVLPDGRILVTEQGGALRLIKADALVATAVITLTVDPSGERGLLGVAVDPGFNGTTNQDIYLYYTVPGSPPHNRVSRFTMSGDTASIGTELPLVNLDNLSGASNHNGGAMHFRGSDGKLYIAVGENANGANAQTLGNRLGKILRVNSDGSIPGDNPFFGTATGDNRAIWALGLRNPFTFAFRRTVGTMFINDVGQSTWEEVNVGAPGANYGWPTTEGPTSNPSFVPPLHSYPHSGSPFPCAITGGTFYDPTTVSFSSDYVGKYFYSDFCAGWVRLLDPAVPQTAREWATGFSGPVDLQVDGSGRLLVLTHNGPSTLFRISAKPAQQFFTLSPCRLLDTRSTDSPAIAANATRTFAIAGKCGVPASAVSVSVNATAVTPTQAGNVMLFPGNFSTAPTANVLSFTPASTRASNAVVALATNGAGSIKVQNASSASIQFVLDVNGYFQ